MSAESGAAVVRPRRRHAWMIAGMMSLVLSACAKTSPEQDLRDAVAGLQAAVEARDASAMQSFLADDFIGPDGLDRDGARRMATLHLMRHDDVGSTIGPLAVQLQGDHARVDFTIALTGGSGRLVPESGQVYAVKTGWRLEDDDWKLTSAEWDAEL